MDSQTTTAPGASESERQFAPVTGSPTFVWTPIDGYEPMEECVDADGREVGWMRPRNIGKHRPQPWGTAADWPGEWEAIPRGEWELSVYCVSYEAAKAHVETSWNTDGLPIRAGQVEAIYHEPPSKPRKETDYDDQNLH